MLLIETCIFWTSKNSEGTNTYRFSDLKSQINKSESLYTSLLRAGSQRKKKGSKSILLTHLQPLGHRTADQIPELLLCAKRKGEHENPQHNIKHKSVLHHIQGKGSTQFL